MAGGRWDRIVKASAVPAGWREARSCVSSPCVNRMRSAEVGEPGHEVSAHGMDEGDGAAGHRHDGDFGDPDGCELARCAARSAPPCSVVSIGPVHRMLLRMRLTSVPARSQWDASTSSGCHRHHHRRAQCSGHGLSAAPLAARYGGGRSHRRPGTRRRHRATRWSGCRPVHLGSVTPRPGPPWRVLTPVTCANI